MIRLPSPVVCVEDAPVPELIVNRTEVADLLAALVRPPPPRRRQPYDVGPGPHSHRDRWRARVNRLIVLVGRQGKKDLYREIERPNRVEYVVLGRKVITVLDPQEQPLLAGREMVPCHAPGRT